jgi:uncharacterized protein involved in exopolysaccharide biosynthesis
MTETKTIQASEIKLADLFGEINSMIKYLLRKWWLIGIVGILCALAGIFYAQSQKAQYESRLTFALEDGGGGMGGAFDIAAQFGFNLGSKNDAFTGDNIIQILSSRRMIERVLLSIDSSEGKKRTFAEWYSSLNKSTKKPKPNAKPGRLAGVTIPVGLERNKFTYLQDSMLYLMYKGITSGNLVAGRPDKKLGIYELRFKSLNEKFSKEFTDRLIDETMAFYTELRSAKSRETLSILENRVGAMRGSTKKAIQQRAAIQDANINPVFQQQQAQIQEQQVDVQAYGGAYAELFKNAEIARYQYLKDIPLLTIIDDAKYPLKLIKLGRLKTGVIGGVLGGFLICLILLVYKQVRIKNS